VRIECSFLSPFFHTEARAVLKQSLTEESICEQRTKEEEERKKENL
jgi:hypothetical protein